MNFLEVLKLGTILGGLTNNTLGGIAVLLVVFSVVAGVASLIILIGAWAEKSLKLFVFSIVLFCTSFINFYSTKTIPVLTEKIVLREYDKNTREITRITGSQPSMRNKTSPVTPAMAKTVT